MQALKAERAVTNSKNKSPSYSTRARTAKFNRRITGAQYYKDNNNLKDLTNLLTGKLSPGGEASKRVESAFIKQSKAEEKDMARRRRLVSAKKNVNKRAR